MPGIEMTFFFEQSLKDPMLLKVLGSGLGVVDNYD